MCTCCAGQCVFPIKPALVRSVLYRRAAINDARPDENIKRVPCRGTVGKYDRQGKGPRAKSHACEVACLLNVCRTTTLLQNAEFINATMYQ